MSEPTPTFRRARAEDLPSIVRMLADDPLGATRERVESPLPVEYREAFGAIERDPNQELIVAEVDGRLAGVLQISFIPCLTHTGTSRALIEGVRVDASLRAAGVGRRMIGHAVERAKARGCGLVQLTSDKSRRDAIRFYESLGFVASHEGMKLRLARGG